MVKSLRTWGIAACLLPSSASCCRLPCPVPPAALISEGILVTPSMMAHHRLFVLSEAFEVSQQQGDGVKLLQCLPSG